MLNIGPGELVLILLLGLLVLGPQKLPEAARQVGRAMAELRRLSSGFQAEIRNAMDEPTIERSPTPLATPLPQPEPDDHEAMNARLAEERDAAVARVEAEHATPTAPVTKVPAKKKAAATKAATAKKQAPAKKAAAKKAAAKKAAAPRKKAAAPKKRA